MKTMPMGQRQECDVSLNAMHMCEQPPLSVVMHGCFDTVNGVIVTNSMVSGSGEKIGCSTVNDFVLAKLCFGVRLSSIDFDVVQKMSSPSMAIEAGFEMPPRNM